MKTIGILGGMSWESTETYLSGIRDGVRARLGGLHSPKFVMISVDFAEIERLQHDGQWDALGGILAGHAKGAQAAGADCLLLATNTMHKVADKIEAAISIPFLHLAEAAADKILSAGFNRAGLLATAFTMEQEFYKGRLQARGLEVLVPDAPDRATVHRVIYDELCRGVISESSRAEYRRIMAGLAERGAQCVILGCTEIGLLVGQDDSPVPVFDTTKIHIEKALDFALG